MACRWCGCCVPCVLYRCWAGLLYEGRGLAIRSPSRLSYMSPHHVVITQPFELCTNTNDLPSRMSVVVAIVSLFCRSLDVTIRGVRIAFCAPVHVRLDVVAMTKQHPGLNCPPCFASLRSLGAMSNTQQTSRHAVSFLRFSLADCPLLTDSCVLSQHRIAAMKTRPMTSGPVTPATIRPMSLAIRPLFCIAFHYSKRGGTLPLATCPLSRSNYDHCTHIVRCLPSCQKLVTTNGSHIACIAFHVGKNPTVVLASTLPLSRVGHHVNINVVPRWRQCKIINRC